MVALPAPPFHQISLPVWPSPPDPPRKLHAVKFCTETLLAFQTTIPLSPSVPPLPAGPKLCAACFVLHRPDPGFVPSITTLLRFIPRSFRLRVVISTAAGVSA